ncbi:MAG: ABC transporter permease [Acetobacterium sp.]
MINKRWPKKSIPFKQHSLLLLPIILLYSLFIGGGLWAVMIESTGFIPGLGLTQFSLNHYREILGNPDFLESLGYSLYLALVSASVSTVFGVFIAYKMVTSQSRMMNRLTKKMLQAGIVLPYLYVVFLIMLMMNRTGFISRVFYQLGFINGLEQFPNLVFDPLGLGIILTFVVKGTPFIALFVVNVMANISNTYTQVAKTLGANNPEILKKIYLPLSSNVILWTSAIIFAYDLGSFEVPYLLGNVKVMSLSSKLYSLYINPNIATIPAAMAMNLTLLWVGLISVGIYSLVLERILRGKRR